MANRGWAVACAFAFVFACNKSDKPSPFAAGSAASGNAAVGSAVSGSAAAGSAGSGSAAVATESDEAPFKVGDVVWSLWSNGFAYRGKLVAINENGTYQVEWDDGHGRDDDWPAERTKHEKPTEDSVKVGDRVWSRPDYWRDKRARQGKIQRINADGTYHMSWDDADDTDLVKEWLSKDKPPPARKQPASTSTASSRKNAGDNACREGNRYTRCDPNHCFNLNVDDHNCGACGHQCPKTARTCSNGQCRCLSGSYDSDGNCI